MREPDVAEDRQTRIAGLTVGVFLLALAILKAAWEIDAHFVTRNELQLSLAQIRTEIKLVRQELAPGSRSAQYQSDLKGDE